MFLCQVCNIKTAYGTRLLTLYDGLILGLILGQFWVNLEKFRANFGRFWSLFPNISGRPDSETGIPETVPGISRDF
jgi:hypothetical protein